MVGISALNPERFQGPKCRTRARFGFTIKGLKGVRIKNKLEIERNTKGIQEDKTSQII